MKNITINGIKKQVRNDILSYAEIIDLVGKEYRDDYTMTYWCSISGKHGSVSNKSLVEIEEGTHLNFCFTGDA